MTGLTDIIDRLDQLKAEIDHVKLAIEEETYAKNRTYPYDRVDRYEAAEKRLEQAIDQLEAEVDHDG